MSVPQWKVPRTEAPDRSAVIHFRYIVGCGIVGLLCIGVALFVALVVPNEPKLPSLPDQVHVTRQEIR
ncbi:MAG TPA: hypothetical protein VHC49_26600 [Mycobacteriales bacterium]|nr:hypothetical protein [Mycobacteriales bacterium]